MANEWDKNGYYQNPPVSGAGNPNPNGIGWTSLEGGLNEAYAEWDTESSIDYDTAPTSTDYYVDTGTIQEK